MNIEDIELGVDTALEAVIAMAQQGMAQAAHRGNDASAFVGFLQGIVAHRDFFRQSIILNAIAKHPESEADNGS